MTRLPKNTYGVVSCSLCSRLILSSSSQPFLQAIAKHLLSLRLELFDNFDNSLRHLPASRFVSRLTLVPQKELARLEVLFVETPKMLAALTSSPPSPVGGCCRASSPPLSRESCRNSFSDPTGSDIRIVLSITGMRCRSYCTRVVREAITEVRGVRAAMVDLDKAAAYVNCSPTTELESLIEAVNSVGYQAVHRESTASPREGKTSKSAGFVSEEEHLKIRLLVQGLVASVCSSKVERTLSAAPGVIQCSVDLATSLATVLVACHQATNILALQHALDVAGPCSLEQSFHLQPVSPIIADGETSYLIEDGGLLNSSQAGKESRPCSEMDAKCDMPKVRSEALAQEESITRVSVEPLPPLASPTAAAAAQAELPNRNDVRADLSSFSVPTVEKEGMSESHYVAVTTPKFLDPITNDDCQAMSIVPIRDKTESANATLSIEGMTCQTCVKTIERALQNMPGVQDAKVMLLTEKAVVTFDPARRPADSLVDTVENVGFGAKLVSVVGEEKEKKSTFRSLQLSIEGMTCQSCVKTVESAVRNLKGVQEGNVMLLTERAIVKIDRSLCTPEDVVEQIEAVGFGATLLRNEEDGGTGVELEEGEKEGSKRTVIALNTFSSSSSSWSILKDELEQFQAVLERQSGVFAVEIDQGNVAEDVTDNVLLAQIKVEFDSERYKVKDMLQFGSSLRFIKIVLDKEHGIVEKRIDRGRFQGEGREGQGSKRNVITEIQTSTQLQRRLTLLSVLLTIPIWATTIASIDSGASSALSSDSFGIPGISWRSLISLPFATVIQFYCGKSFYISAYRGLRHFSLGMAMLVVMGTTTAYVYAAATILYGLVTQRAEEGDPEMLFDSATLMTFVLIGKYLEHLAKRRTTEAVSRLMSMQPRVALRLVSSIDGAQSLSDSAEVIEEVDVDALRPGDVVKVVSGALIPADGAVINGEGEVDESSLTGESVPVAKRAGASVIGGSKTISGCLYVAVEKVGAASTLHQIIRLVEESQLSRAPMQEIADKISAVFVPMILAIAAASFIVWYLVASQTDYLRSSDHDGGNTEMEGVEEQPEDEESPFLFALMFFISSVVVACPCALGLATPTAVMVGTGLGTRFGILIKGGEPLHTAQAATAIVFDKTGTLTLGTPQVRDWHSLENTMLSCSGEVSSHAILRSSEDKEALYRFACAEALSEHPLAKAIVDFYQNLSVTEGAPAQEADTLSLLRPQSFDNSKPGGIACISHDGRAIHMGTESFLTAFGISVEAVKYSVDSVYGSGEDGGIQDRFTRVYAAQDGIVLGVFLISDGVRPEAPKVIASLLSKNRGRQEETVQRHGRKQKKKTLTVYMLTGDNKQAAMAVAARVGLPEENVIAEVLPGGKLDFIRSLQEKGETVAMVGDGINDSPALAQADIGIAIGAGTQVALETAGVVLVKSNLWDVVTFLHLSSVVYRRIWINFFWAFIYNVTLIPFACGIWYPLTGFMLPPWASGMAMALSSVSVVLSSLSLNFYKPPAHVE